jgi:2-dehydro-3-deoxyphosphooctonate aldolase (KDO 8-P synthase)
MQNTQYSSVQVKNITIGLDHKLVVIAGPCVIESEQMAIDTAAALKEITQNLGIPFIYKSSYDKANRSSGKSFRGLGIDKGLAILQKVRETLDVAVLTDVHSIDEIKAAAEIVDIIQTPAFLCRQTDFIEACATCGKPVNIKKGQFLAPQDMLQVVEKARIAAQQANIVDKIMVCERGASFGYNNLVSDMRSIAILRQTQAPVIFDATHSVQLPGGQGTSSGGQREFVPVLARAAVAAGIAGIFLETHPNPNIALSDGPNAIPLKHIKNLLHSLMQIDNIIKQQDFLETYIQTW